MKKKKAFRYSAEKNEFPILGIGSSAGGLEALQLFFQHMPADSGIAIILIQHLDPGYKGMMPELLRRMTSMKVTQVTDQLKIEPDCVYIIPPNRNMSILHGTLHLMDLPPLKGGMRLPIDFFFRHMADDQQEKSIGVILSGMGSDGSLGMRAIKEKMGMTIAQDPATAKYDGMPGSIVAAGLADYVVPVEQIPDIVIKHVNRVVSVKKAKILIDEKTQGSLDKIFILLRAKTGHDFSLYKKSTLYRRIERRMGIQQLNSIADYVRFVQENPHEAELLFKELLIGITNFFRDSQAFEALREEAIPMLLNERTPGSEIRVWVTGCSTGEEAYSLAIVLKEAINDIRPGEYFKIQVFATDLDKDAIERARRGVYPANIATDVSAERLGRFFVKDDLGYRISKEIREMLIFAPHNLISDPPFTKIDILSCRNLLIYLTHDLQKKLIRLFHYSLNPEGVLFLGSAETIGNYSEYFKTLNSKWKLYQKKYLQLKHHMVDFPYATIYDDIIIEETKMDKKENSTGVIQDIADHLIVQTMAPPSVLINKNGDIVYILGQIGKYLLPTAGRVNMNVHAMVREDLRLDLESAVNDALLKQEPIKHTGLLIKTDAVERFLNLSVRPISFPPELNGLLLVTFEEVEIPIKSVRSRRKRITADVSLEARNEELEKRSRYLEDYFHSTQEQMQTQEEELRSANEELQSTNEELQSTNEELTTSKEELQSLNEELMSVNAELQTKIDELTRTHDDMNNLLNSTELAVLFLDCGMNVRSFTPQATRIFKLISSDINRPFTDITSTLRYEHMLDDAKEVLGTLIFKEMEIEATNSDWFRIRIMPYRTNDNVIDGLVITFTDITAFKRLEKIAMTKSSKTNKG
jgi:two-component system, chemotaxis family, CheB/CheR fusion protein